MAKLMTQPLFSLSYSPQILHHSLTTGLTTFTHGLRVNNAHESAKRKNFRAECGQKVLKNPVTTGFYGFGSRMSQVQILSFRPYRVFIRDFTYEYSIFCLDTVLFTEQAECLLFSYAGSSSVRYSTATPLRMAALMCCLWDTSGISTYPTKR